MLIENPEIFCMGNPEELFDIPAKIHTAFNKSHTTICSTNFTSVKAELGYLFDINTLMNKVIYCMEYIVYLCVFQLSNNTI